MDHRLNDIDWARVESDLDARGWAVLPDLLPEQTCRDVAALYPRPDLFRSRVIMSRHGFGRGEYQYFSDPLPPLVLALREGLYAGLVPVANRWHSQLAPGPPNPEPGTRNAEPFPADHRAYRQRCHAAGQTRPTPLLLQYGPGDYNCLHQDVYGDLVFPIQVACLLSRPGQDFEGGEFVLTEQRPRMQSRAEVVPLRRGDGVIFPVRHRPVRGTRGSYRVNVRHGVSRVRSGSRHTLGIIFHDAT
jgi:hypothetical protein